MSIDGDLPFIVFSGYKILSTEEILITTDDSSSLTVTNSKLSFDNFLVFTEKGKVVGTVDAHFDISKMPPEYHVLMVNMLFGRRLEVGLSHDLYYPADEQPQSSKDWMTAPVDVLDYLWNLIPRFLGRR